MFVQTFTSTHCLVKLEATYNNLHTLKRKRNKYILEKKKSKKFQGVTRGRNHCRIKLQKGARQQSETLHVLLLKVRTVKEVSKLGLLGVKV